MCWNQYVSLNTFVFSMGVLGLMMYNDYYTPYKITFVNNIYFYFFIVSFSSMQLIEYFLWKNIHNKARVRTISIFGQLLVMLQPIVSLLMLKNALLKWSMILLYSIPAAVNFISCKKNYTTTVVNGHLKWKWMTVSDTSYAAWLFFLMFSFVVNGDYFYVGSALFLFAITYWSNYTLGTAGSLWCWSINLIMIYFAVKLLIVLPFQEHGIC